MRTPQETKPLAVIWQSFGSHSPGSSCVCLCFFLMRSLRWLKGRPPGRRVRIAFRGSLFCLRDAPLAVISHRLTFGSSPAGTARLLAAGRLRLLSNQNARRACPPLYRSQSHCIRSACHLCLWNVPRPPRMKGLHTEVQIVHSSVSASPRQIPACDCCWYGAIAVGTYYSTVVPKLGRVNCVRRTKG